MLSKIKAFFSQREKTTIFFLALAIVSLINVNYSILRSLRNTLVVSCTSAGAELIPAIQLWGLLPLTFLLVYVISLFMRKYSQAKVFFLVTLLFLGFFNIHAFLIYPFQTQLEASLTPPSFLKPISSLYLLCKHWASGSYFIAAELWKVAILSLLFFGFLNRSLSLKEAKGMYSPLLLGGSIGGLLAGPTTVIASKISPFMLKSFGFSKWHATYLVLTVIMTLVGFMIMGLFSLLKNKVKPSEIQKEESKAKISFKDSLKTFIHNRYLFSLGVIVIADYIAYFLFEVFFLDLLKTAYPDPNKYCQFNGQLTFWTSVLTLISALFVTPILLHKRSWKTAALVTPSAIGLSIIFFAMVIGAKTPWMQNLSSILGMSATKIAIIFGSIQFCVCRAIKGTLFDASKELAYFPLSEDLKSKGKLVVDGLASRTGYCLAAGINQSLFSVFGSLYACLPAAALISCVAVAFSIKGVLHISSHMQPKPQSAL
jgi:ATP:ADP antiporter, AAA family